MMHDDQYGKRCGGITGRRSTAHAGSHASQFQLGEGRQGDFDPDYQRWRSEHERGLDDDYRSWRQDQQRSFADEFNRWRAARQYKADASRTGTGTLEDDRERTSGITGS